MTISDDAGMKEDENRRYRDPPDRALHNRRWRADPALFGAYGSLVAVPGGYAAAAMVGSGPTASLWTSRNGLEWVPVAGVDLSGLDLIGLVSDGRRALLIGTGPSGPKLWVSDGLQP